MISINHRLFGRWLPTYFFAEDPEQIPFGLCFWVSRCYFDPALMQKSGYTVLLSRWWRTLFTDLTLPLETIYQSFDKKSTRYPLNVAQRLLSVGRWQVVPPMKHQDDDDRLIVDFYRRKHLGENDTVEKLKASPTRPYWLTSRALYEGRVVLVRTNICDPRAGITRSLYAVSAELPSEIKQEAGHISRWLCWQEIQYFKEKGYRIYDWGGISKHGELKGIDDFKRSFGGKEGIIYDALICQRYIAPVLRVIWKIRYGKYPEVEPYEGEANKIC
jgi:hypothetical protein